MPSTSSNVIQPPVRILLVDDNAHGLSARRVLLEQLGYTVLAESTPTAALRAFRQERFDLVVTDFRMPEMDGIALIAEIRRTLPMIPIVLISGFVDALGLNEKNTGADIVIQKSNLEVVHLTRAVARLLKRKPGRKPPDRQEGESYKVVRGEA